MENRPGPIFPIFLAVVLAGPASALAQGSNGTYTVIQDMVSSGGGSVGGGNPMRAQTILGLPASGAASNGTFSLIGGFGIMQAVPVSPTTIAVTVTGTVEDPSGVAEVTVNGVNSIPAAVVGNTFTATDVLLALGPNTLTATAKDTLGNTASKSITVYVDLPQDKKTPRFAINVTGAVDDPGATVWVNGIEASVNAGTGEFVASGVSLVSGLNTLTATAKDAVGNTATASIHVFVPPATPPPARPTVGTVGGPIPAVTTQPSITIGGTKTPGTSIWINGQQVVALGDSTTWTVTLTLVEGDNELAVVAKDATGTPSAEAIVNIILDNLAPVVTFAPPTKTNLTPVPLTGSVDDSQTTVTINGVSAARTKRTFEISVPLTPGQNTLTLIAVSPNMWITSLSYPITLGAIPSIQAVQPPDGAKLYAGATTTLQATVHDPEGDPIQYRFLLDGALLADWTSSAAQPWTPLVTQLGLHTLTIHVRDAYGGMNGKELEVFVIRRPVDHP